MDNSNKTTPPSDEIEFSQIFKWIGNGFRRFGNGFIGVLAGLRAIFFNNKLLFAGIILIGLIIGAGYYSLLNKNQYKSTMVIRCEYLTFEVLENTIESLNLLVKETDREGLAEILQIDVATARNIAEFGFRTFVTSEEIVQTEVLKEQLRALDVEKKGIAEQLIAKIELQNTNAYEIIIEVFDPEVVKPLEGAIVNYFRNNDYIRKRMENNETGLKLRKAKLIAESKKLDSLKRVLFENYQNLGKTSKGSGNVILGDERIANPLDVFREDLSLHSQILEIDQQLYVKPNFEVLKGFTTFRVPSSASLPLILAISFAISFVAGYIFIGAVRLDKLLAEHSRRKANAVN